MALAHGRCEFSQAQPAFTGNTRRCVRLRTKILAELSNPAFNPLRRGDKSGRRHHLASLSGKEPCSQSARRGETARTGRMQMAALPLPGGAVERTTDVTAQDDLRFGAGACADRLRCRAGAGADGRPQAARRRAARARACGPRAGAACRAQRPAARRTRAFAAGLDEGLRQNPRHRQGSLLHHARLRPRRRGQCAGAGAGHL